MNDQRKVVYEQRRDIMRAPDVHETIVDMRREVVDNLVGRFIPEKALPEQWEAASLHEELLRITGIDFPVVAWAAEEGIADDEIRERINGAIDRRMAEKSANWGPEMMRFVEKSVLLQLLDQVWKDHLLALDHLRQGIGLRAYAQKDPLNEYKSEAFELFDAMLSRLREQVTGTLCHVEVQQGPAEDVMPQEPDDSSWQETRQDPAFAETDGDGDTAVATRPAARRMVAAAAADIDPEDPSTWGKVSRNAPCPCGSGKKFKQCHGRFA